jgi:hypothetical protein
MPRMHGQNSPSEDPSSGNSMKMSRRSFGRRAATVAALTLSPDTVAAPQASPQESLAQAKPKSDAIPGLGWEATQDLEAKLANIIRKYGSRLSGEQREHLRRILVYNERMLAEIRAFSLQNGDPPASVLRVSFRDEKTAPAMRRDVVETDPNYLGRADRWES